MHAPPVTTSQTKKKTKTRHTHTVTHTHTHNTQVITRISQQLSRSASCGMHENDDDNYDEGKLVTVVEEVEDIQDKVYLNIDIPNQTLI